MRVVVQRVSEAQVVVNQVVVGTIKQGYVLLVALTHRDQIVNIHKMADRIYHLRLFSDINGKMNLPIESVQGSILSISQFTLYGDAMNSRRPSFTAAAPAAIAEQLYNEFNRSLREKGLQVETGQFGADMKLSLINDGPVTILLDDEIERSES